MEKQIITFLVVALLLVSPISAGYHTQDLPQEAQKSVFKIAEAAEDHKQVTRSVWITAYSSTPEETDDTPFITASMTQVRDGIVAANFLDFGTEIRIPRLFGDKVFVVEDRMHRRKKNFVDIWMPSKMEALEFGIHHTDIVILAN